MNVRNLAIWGVILIAVALIYSVMQGQSRSPTAPADIAYSDLLTRVDDGQISKVQIHGYAIDVFDKSGHEFHAVGPSDNDTVLQQRLSQHKDITWSYQPPGPSMLVTILMQTVPILLLVGGLGVLHAPDAGRRARRHGLRQVQGAPADREQEPGDLRGRRRRRRGQGRAAPRSSTS